jgi:PAS domain S-box-containing protein
VDNPPGSDRADRADELQCSGAHHGVWTDAIEGAAAELLNSMSEVALLVSSDLTILCASPGLARSLGVPLPSLIGTPALSHVPADVAASRGARMAEVLRSGQPVHFEDQNTGRSFSNSIYPILDADGRVCRMAVFCRDVTAQREAERKAAERLQILDSILETSPAGIVLVRDRVPIWASDAMVALSGQSMEEQIARGPRSLYPDQAEYERVGRELYARGPGQSTGEVYTTWVRDDGTRVQVHLQSRLLDAADPARGYIVTATDVTDRTRYEQEIQASLERYRGLYDAMPGGVMVYGADGVLRDANDAACRLLGIPRGELIGQGLPIQRWNVVGEDGTPVPDDLRPSNITLRTGRRVRNFVAGLSLPGSQRVTWLLINSEPRMDPATCELEAVVVTMVDIGERKRAMDALQASERRFREIAELLPDMLFEFDSELRVTYINTAVTRIMGYSQADVDAGLSASDMVDADTISRAARHLARSAATGSPVVGIFDINRRDGTPMPTENHAMAVRGQGGELVGYRVVCRDITDRKRAEEAQRLATVGQLAAGVAHEFNNLLAAVLLEAEVAKDDDTVEEYHRLVELVLRTARHGRDICRSLSTFAHPGRPEPQPLRIESVIDEALSVAARTIGNAGIVVHRDYHPAGQGVEGDPGQLGQVFLNLIVNACHAMPRGGTLTVATQHHHGTSRTGHVVVKVSDTGVGIRPEHMNRIFEPFFTTSARPAATGSLRTGLGLSVSLGIVRAHGGTITASSKLGEGTTFEVVLPERDGTVAPPASPPEEDSAPVATETQRALNILVADDHPDLGSFIQAVLQVEGHTVTAARTTDDALAAMREERFDLVVTDLLMPGGGGRAVLAYAASQERPPRIVVMTGLVDEPLEREMTAAGAAAVLRKPFTRAEITRLVHELFQTSVP